MKRPCRCLCLCLPSLRRCVQYVWPVVIYAASAAPQACVFVHYSLLLTRCDRLRRARVTDWLTDGPVATIKKQRGFLNTKKLLVSLKTFPPPSSPFLCGFFFPTSLRSLCESVWECVTECVCSGSRRPAESWRRSFMCSINHCAFISCVRHNSERRGKSCIFFFCAKKKKSKTLLTGSNWICKSNSLCIRLCCFIFSATLPFLRGFSCRSS